MNFLIFQKIKILQKVYEHYETWLVCRELEGCVEVHHPLTNTTACRKSFEIYTPNKRSHLNLCSQFAQFSSLKISSIKASNPKKSTSYYIQQPI